METEPLEILLVEDDPADAELTMRALRGSNLANAIIHVNDGVEALDYLFGTGRFEGRDTNRTPKVVVLDLKLPRLSGTEVLERIRADERTRHVPVVILTSSREDRDLIETYERGANSFVVKPVDFEGFADAVRELGLYWLLLNRTPAGIE